MRMINPDIQPLLDSLMEGILPSPRLGRALARYGSDVVGGRGRIRYTQFCHLAGYGWSGLNGPSEGYTPEFRFWSVHYQSRVPFSDSRHRLIPDGDSPRLNPAVKVVRTHAGFGQKKLERSKTVVSGLDLAVRGLDAVGLIAA